MAARFERDKNGVLYLLIEKSRIPFSEKDFETLVRASAGDGQKLVRTFSDAEEWADEWTDAQKQLLKKYPSEIYAAAHQDDTPPLCDPSVICRAKNGDTEYFQSDDSWSLDRDNARKYGSEREAKEYAENRLWKVLDSHDGMVIVDPDSIKTP